MNKSQERSLDLIQELIEILIENDCEEILFTDGPVVVKHQGNELFRCYGVKTEDEQLLLFGTENFWEKVSAKMANLHIVLEALKAKLNAFFA